MFLRQLFDHDTYTFTYLVADPTTKEALLIDPVVGQMDRDLRLIDELGFELKYALDTHVHADHVTASGRLRERCGAQVVASKLGPETADIHVTDGDTLQLGSLTLTVLETPGHTDDSITFKVGEHLFTGDTILVRGTGRSDFQNGNAAQLYESITRKIFVQSDATQVWPAHDYRGHCTSTVGEEKRLNPRLANRSKADFIGIMDNLNLPAPKFLEQALPANKECGLGVALEDLDVAVGESSPERVATFLGDQDAAVIDVREPHEFDGELGHIEGATNLPREEIAQAALDWTFDKPILVVCRSGRRSRAVCQQLAKRGFRNVENLEGGMLAYRQEYPVSTPPKSVNAG